MVRSSNRRTINPFYPLFSPPTTWQQNCFLICWCSIWDWLSQQVAFNAPLHIINSIFPWYSQQHLLGILPKGCLDPFSLLFNPAGIFPCGKGGRGLSQCYHSCPGEPWLLGRCNPASLRHWPASLLPPLPSSVWSSDGFWWSPSVGCWPPALAWKPSWKFPLKFSGSSQTPTA